MHKLKTVAVMIAAILIVGMPSANAEKPILISSCGAFLTEPANYVLASDLEMCAGDPSFFGAVTIASSDVTLNMDGHTITCDPEDGLPNTGITIFGASNVTIVNGSVSGCDVGIFAFNVADSDIKSMSLTSNLPDPIVGGGCGIIIDTSSDNHVAENHISGNRLGICMSDSSSNKVTDNIVAGNFASGIDVASFVGVSNDNRFSGNKLSNNGNAGIVFLGESSGNRVSCNTVTGNGIGGIAMVSLSPNVLPPSGNFVSDNISTENAAFDMVEARFDFSTFSFEVVEPCRNTWDNNSFSSQVGPQNCIGSPVPVQNLCDEMF